MGCVCVCVCLNVVGYFVKLYHACIVCARRRARLLEYVSIKIIPK